MATWRRGLVAAAEPEWVSESEVPACRRLAVGARATMEMEEEQGRDQLEEEQGRMHQACLLLLDQWRSLPAGEWRGPKVQREK